MLRTSVILWIGFWYCLPVNGQRKLSFELYGAPSINWLRASPATISLNSKVETANPIQFNFGLNSLYRITPRYQLAAEMEFSKVPFTIKEYNQLPNGSITTTSRNKTNLTHLRVGMRYSKNRNKISYYFQPAVGIAISSNRFNDESDSTLNRTNNLQNINPLSLTAKGELGVKFLTDRRCYFILGIRHQFGFNQLDKRTFVTDITSPPSQISITSSGSYSSLFLGIGFNQKSKVKPLRNIESGQRRVRSELLAKDGPYAILLGGVRLKEYGYSFPSIAHFGSSTLSIGEKFRNFYGEVGLGIVGPNETYQINHDGHKGLILRREPYTIRFIPATLKYAIPISSRTLNKLGVSFTANYIVSGRDYSGSGRGSGSRTINGTVYTYTGQYTSDALEPRRTFFNAGLYYEKEAFNVGFFNFKLSRNFGSDVQRRISASYTINGTPYNVTTESRLNGFLAEFGFRLPFAVLSKGQKRQQKMILDLEKRQ